MEGHDTHHILVSEQGAHCTCGRARETPDHRDARTWANNHFRIQDYATITDKRLDNNNG